MPKDLEYYKRERDRSRIEHPNINWDDEMNIDIPKQSYKDLYIDAIGERMQLIINYTKKKRL